MILRKKKNDEVAVAALDNASTYDVIIRPMITEKSTLASEQNKMSFEVCLLYTSPSPRDQRGSRMPSSA